MAAADHLRGDLVDPEDGDVGVDVVQDVVQLRRLIHIGLQGMDVREHGPEGPGVLGR